MSSFRVQKSPDPRGFQPQGCRLCPKPLALYVAETEGEGGNSNNGTSGGKFSLEAPLRAPPIGNGQQAGLLQ